MPRGLHAQLADAAEREGVSLNQLIVYLLSSATGTPPPDSPKKHRRSFAAAK